MRLRRHVYTASLMSASLAAFAWAVGCSPSAEETILPSTNGEDAGGDALADARVSDDAGSDANDDGGEAGTPPPYDFAVECASDPCVTQIAAHGGGHACAILQNGAVYCWGANDSGQLGVGRLDGGSFAAFEAAPRQAKGVPNATSVATFGQGSLGTTCVVYGSGDVACFGADTSGQLGSSSGPSDGPHPEALSIEGLQAKSVSLSNTFALAIGKDDRLWSWGGNDGYQLARRTAEPDAAPVGPSSPPALAGLVVQPVRSCAGTSKNGFVVTESGEVLSWGGDTSDQLGRASSLQVEVAPSAIALSAVATVATGASHACALARGHVSCWGQNDHGQLGTGTRAVGLFPASAALPSSVYAVHVIAGGDDTCILAASGDVYCWGANGSGQLGRDPGQDSSIPQRMEGLTEQAVGIGVMAESICVLLRSGTVSCRGDNLFGQLGRGMRDAELHVQASPVSFK